MYLMQMEIGHLEQLMVEQQRQEKVAGMQKRPMDLEE
jgi:hypothetical protein